VNRRIEALLASVDPVAINGGQVTLAAAYDFHRKRLNEDEVRRVVEEAISRVTGRLLTINCVMRGEEPPQAPIAFAPAAAPRPVPSSQPVEPPPTLDATNDEPPDLDDTTSTDRDQQRLQAAKNIFDAEEIRS
jgi:hypothetical protein